VVEPHESVRPATELAPAHHVELTGKISRANPRRARWIWGAIGLAAALAVPLVGVSAIALSSLVVLIAVAGFAAAERDPGTSSGAESQLRLANDTVEVLAPEGRVTTALPRESIADGWIEPHAWDAGHTLVLVARDGLQLRFARRGSTEAAEGLLRALGLDDRAVRLFLVAGSRLARGFMGLFMGLMIVWGLMPLLFALGAELGGGYAAMLAGWIVNALVFLTPVISMPHYLVPNRLLVGRDGVLVERLFRRRRYVRYAELASTSTGPDTPGLVLVRKDGTELVVRAGAEAGPTARRVVDERLARFHLEGGSQIVAALERGELSLQDYAAKLRSLLNAGRANFRRAVLHDDDLLRVVEDPKARPKHRVAAAYALVAQDDAPRQRLRVAVEGCADPRLRTALERASEGDLDEASLAEAERATPPHERARAS
jgi:hypothetical protein